MTTKKKESSPSPMQLLRRARRRGVSEVLSTAAATPAPEVPVHPLVNVWTVRSVEEQPHIEMVRWRVFEVGETFVLSGFSVTNGWGRRSTGIVAVDSQRMRVTTSSGRIYHLVGPPGFDADAEYVLNMSLGGATYTDVTAAFCKTHGIAIVSRSVDNGKKDSDL
jgi:hypothetical protein